MRKTPISISQRPSNNCSCGTLSTTLFRRLQAWRIRIIGLKREDRHFLIYKLTEVLHRGFDNWATRICSAYKNVWWRQVKSIFVGGEEALFRFILSLGLSKYTTASGICAFVDIAYAKRTFPMPFSRNYRDYRKDLLKMLLMTRDWWAFQTRSVWGIAISTVNLSIAMLVVSWRVWHHRDSEVQLCISIRWGHL